ncbi:MAG: nucleotide exchange factor GrpE, partial [Firmicutes bacterium]|nr:nucleotide exchange factor GrpE [Candidatus Fermentithermobacillaceae bacterium]
QVLTLERDQWKSKAEDYWDRYLRARSEMENFRKRTERDIHRRVNRGKAELILPLLDVLDNFDRALAAGEKNAEEDRDGAFKAFYDGVVLIRRQILDVLAREGVEPMEDPVGKPFDPEYHEAVFAQEGGGEHGAIVEVFQRGYMYKGEVIRPSRVKVIR